MSQDTYDRDREQDDAVREATAELDDEWRDELLRCGEAEFQRGRAEGYAAGWEAARQWAVGHLDRTFFQLLKDRDAFIRRLSGIFGACPKHGETCMPHLINMAKLAVWIGDEDEPEDEDVCPACGSSPAEVADSAAWERESKRRLVSAVPRYGPAGAAASVAGPLLDWAVEIANDQRAVDKPPAQENDLGPLGLRPRYIHAAFRCTEIEEAMNRFFAAGREVPDEWEMELEDQERWARGRRKAVETGPLMKSLIDPADERDEWAADISTWRGFAARLAELSALSFICLADHFKPGLGAAIASDLGRVAASEGREVKT